jgi:hypothetical protein
LIGFSKQKAGSPQVLVALNTLNFLLNKPTLGTNKRNGRGYKDFTYKAFEESQGQKGVSLHTSSL